jgi:hypothetical protein
MTKYANPVVMLEIKILPTTRTAADTYVTAPILAALRKIKKKALRADSQKAVPKMAH